MAWVFRCAVLNKTPKAAVMAVVRHDAHVVSVKVREVGLGLICMVAVNFLGGITE